MSRLPLHPQAVSLLTTLELPSETPLEATPLAELRRDPAPVPTPWLWEVRDLDAGGIPARLYRPVGTPGLGLLVWFHGGGFVLGSLNTHDRTCRRLAKASGHCVLSVSYRLAPEHPFPAALDDATRALQWAGLHAQELGCDPGRLAVGGDSAGANLATVVALTGAARLAYQLLLYPVTDCTLTSQGYDEAPTGFPVTRLQMRWFVNQYLSGTTVDPTDPRVSPLRASMTDLAGAPPALVVTAGADALHDEGAAYAARLAGAGVTTSHVSFGGMPHGFVGYADHLDDAKAAISLMATSLAACFERTES